jgi:hypothetical protein
VATKKRRRSQLARATAQRQQSRRAQRLARRRRRRLAATALAVLVLVAALVTWILVHGSGAGSARAAGVDYAAPIETPTAAIAPSQHEATTTEGVR